MTSDTARRKPGTEADRAATRPDEKLSAGQEFTPYSYQGPSPLRGAVQELLL